MISSQDLKVFKTASDLPDVLDFVGCVRVLNDERGKVTADNDSGHSGQVKEIVASLRL